MIVSGHAKFPRHRTRFACRVERFQKPHPMLLSIPAIFTNECSLVLEAYYGGPIRAGWHLIWWGVQCGVRRCWWGVLLAFTDRIGWTRLTRIEGTRHFERHGRNCDGECEHNPEKIDCITPSLPRWFRLITGWRR